MGRHMQGKSPNITQLRPWHRRMAEQLALGMHPSEIADYHEVTKSHLSRIIGSPVFELYLASLEKDLINAEYYDYRSDINMMLEKAIKNLDEDLNMEVGDSDALRRIRQKASFGVTEIFGIKSTTPTTQNINNTQININDASKEDLRKHVFNEIDSTEVVDV